MKTKLKTSLTILMVAGMVFAQSSLSAKQSDLAVNVKPYSMYVFSGKGLKSTFGGGLSAGTTLYKYHTLSLDSAYFAPKYKHMDGKMQFIPLTFNYQFDLPLTERFHVSAGCFTGAVFEKNKGNNGLGHGNRTAFTYGASLEAGYDITKNVSVNAFGKWMHINSKSDLRSRDIPMVGLNLCFKY